MLILTKCCCQRAKRPKNFGNNTGFVEEEFFPLKNIYFLFCLDSLAQDCCYELHEEVEKH